METPMQPIVLLIFQLIAVVAGPILLALWIRRRWGAPWSALGWGALAFVGSQAVRLPLLIGSSLILNPFFTDTDPNVLFWINLVILSLTSGLFEEGARYLMMRWPAKKVRRWKDGLMFGAGHGGIEAILLVGLGVINAIVLLSLGDTLVDQTRAVAPDQADALATQLAELRNLAWYMPLISLWERTMAIILHIALSITVIIAVRDRRLTLLLAAMALHAAFNAVALIALRYGGIVASEVAITIMAILPVWIILRTRRADESMTHESPVPSTTGP
jgi:uncharacterized membrane protein YhfC